MKNIYHIIFISILALLLLSCSSTNQIGKLYTPDEANKLFGTVIYSVDINTTVLAGLLKKTDKSIMFGLLNKQLIILDNKRHLLYPEKADYKDSDVFTVYSTDVLMELLSSKALNKDSGSDPENINVEQRREVLSVSTDSQVLETGNKCPPYCPN